LTDLGFEYVTLDMAGYRTGSVSPGGEGETAGDGDGADDGDSASGTDETGGAADGSESATTGVDLGRQYPR
ncbi:alpha hydrolase, partial [Halorubrum sp. SS5]